MNKIILTALCLISIQTLNAQLVITPNQTATYLANKLVATSGTLGVVISNAVLTCDTNANGEFTGVSNLGIADGIVLGSGDVASNIVASTFGLDGLPSDFASTSNNHLGDSQLDSLIMGMTYDACVLEFDIQPVGSTIEFEYVFGSEEYPEFICSFNDVFGFFITGPGFSSPTNIALIPSTTTHVSINTINDGTGSCVANSLLYIDNTGTTSTIDGFTTPLIASATVTPSATYHLKMAIADASDGIFNSYVILKANSLKSSGVNPNGINILTKASGLEVYPTIIQDVLTIHNLNGKEWNLSIADVHGRLIHKMNIASNEVSKSIHLPSLAKGIYILNAKSSDSEIGYVQKLIKE